MTRSSAQRTQRFNILLLKTRLDELQLGVLLSELEGIKELNGENANAAAFTTKSTEENTNTTEENANVTEGASELDNENEYLILRRELGNTSKEYILPKTPVYYPTKEELGIIKKAHAATREYMKGFKGIKSRKRSALLCTSKISLNDATHYFRKQIYNLSLVYHLNVIRNKEATKAKETQNAEARGTATPFAATPVPYLGVFLGCLAVLSGVGSLVLIKGNFNNPVPDSVKQGTPAELITNPRHYPTEYQSHQLDRARIAAKLELN